MIAILDLMVAISGADNPQKRPIQILFPQSQTKWTSSHPRRPRSGLLQSVAHANRTVLKPCFKAKKLREIKRLGSMNRAILVKL